MSKTKYKGVIILGSSNSKGDTYEVVKYLAELSSFPIIDLKQKNIGVFDYEFKNVDDDFLPLMRDIVNNYEIIVFATPVYWYTMSGTMKIFFDRITDCLKIEKETGRKLRGMKMAALSCSNDSELVDGFFMPFIASADYLGMDYIGDLHSWVEKGNVSEEVKANLRRFSEKLYELN